MDRATWDLFASSPHKRRLHSEWVVKWFNEINLLISWLVSPPCWKARIMARWRQSHYETKTALLKSAINEPSMFTLLASRCTWIDQEGESEGGWLALIRFKFSAKLKTNKVFSMEDPTRATRWAFPSSSLVDCDKSWNHRDAADFDRSAPPSLSR